MLHVHGAQLVLGREAVQLAAGDGAHQGGLQAESPAELVNDWVRQQLGKCGCRRIGACGCTKAQGQGL